MAYSGQYQAYADAVDAVSVDGEEYDERLNTSGNVQSDILSTVDSALGADDLDAVDDNADDATSGSNVRVIVRVRPLLDGELNSNHQSSLIHINHERVRVNANDGAAERISATSLSTGHLSIGVKESSTVHQFRFDAILTPQHNQLDVYEAGRVAKMLQALLKGYNGTIFAYGMTGSGKVSTERETRGREEAHSRGRNLLIRMRLPSHFISSLSFLIVCFLSVL